MSTTTWKWVGLVMAVMGAVSLASAEQQHKGASKGDHGGSGERPTREQMMQKYDQDGDGQLSDAELDQLRADRSAMRGGVDGNQKGGGHGKRPSKEEILKRFDTDGNGQLSEEERADLRSAMAKHGVHPGRGNREEMTKRFDADGDGQLNEKERAVMRETFEKRKHEQQQSE